MGTSHHPFVSVVMPTFRRPDLLPRAVESVLAQTFTDFELLVSDDEREAGESRRYIEQIARRDARVKLLVHTGTPGQAGNINFAMSQARGEWIKPAYDDDELLPACLERMVGSVRACPNAVMARCLTEFRDARGGVRRSAIGCRPRVEGMSGPDALLALFVQDVEIGSPTQLLLRRDAVLAGAWFPTRAGLVGGLDELWYTHLLQHGDLVLVNEVLTAHDQTGHDTITSGLTPDAFDQEMLLLRREQFPLVRAARPTPALDSVQAALLIERALWRITHGHPVAGVRMLARARDRSGWGLAIRWLLRRLLPGRFEAVPRVRVAA